MSLHFRAFLAGLLLISAFLILGCATTKSSSLKTHQGWQNVYNFGEASFIDNEIHLLSTGNWFYLTKTKYSDFVFEADVLMPNVTEYSNSGIIFRAAVHPSENGKSAYAFGYQAEVDPSLRKWSGGLYEQGTKRQWLYPLHEKRSAPGEHFITNVSPNWSEQKANAYKHLEWNSYRIQAIGPEIKIWVNGILTTHVIDNKTASGFIGIQHHGSKSFKQTGDRTNIVKFKNLQIKDLKKGSE